MKKFTKQIRATCRGNTINPLLDVSYHKSDELFIIVNNKNNSLEIDRKDIPTLIAMLQSVSSSLK